MGIKLTAPNVLWYAHSPVHEGRKAGFESLGFRVEERGGGGGVLVEVRGIVDFPAETPADVEALQRRIGLPIRLDDGVWEIRDD